METLRDVNKRSSGYMTLNISLYLRLGLAHIFCPVVYLVGADAMYLN